MAITSRDVAREAGVSQPTVSRALSGDPRISRKTREHIVEVARSLGYFPNTAARTLITNRTLTVGAVVGDISNLFFSEQVNALYYELLAHGYRMVLFQEGASHVETGEDVVPLLIGNALDGAIFTTGNLDSVTPRHLVEKGIPIVLLNRYIERTGADQVTADNVQGGGLAAQYLAELGHRRIGLITGPENTSTSRDREKGFRSGLKEFGLSLPEELRRIGLYSHESGYRLCLELLKNSGRPTAIFCANDVIALGALNAAEHARLRVPEDVSILGFDDLRISSWETVQLSTVHLPISHMAELAATMLVERIERTREGPARQEVMQTHLVERSTTAPPPP